jgi:hypothetical protein
MSDVRSVEMVDEHDFIAAAPYKIEALLESIARGAIAKGVDNVEGARETEGVIEERVPVGIAVLDGAIDAG